MKTSRGAAAVLIVVLWVAGIAMMVHRNSNRSEAQRLAEVALRVQPATFYYAIERAGEQIGAASSAIDTTENSLFSEEYFVGDYSPPAEKSIERTSARWQTRLTRGLHLISLGVNIVRRQKPFSINATIQDDTSIFIAGKKATHRPPARYTFAAPLFTPTIAPIVFMLGDRPTVGRSQAMSIFDPVTRIVVRPTLRIGRDSLFTVVDSAKIETDGEWIAAHSDTVRAWRIDGAPHDLLVWVDAEGRIVAARAGDLSATRTAFEIAFRNSKTK
ncbi:MAG: hypothetical protein ACREMS_06975 [Gemmatimonadaceae bacterium]